MRFDSTVVKAVDFREWVFPHCNDDARWASAVTRVFAEGKVTGLSAAVVTDVRTSLVPTDLLPASPQGRDAILHLELGDIAEHQVVSNMIGAWDAEAIALLPTSIGDLLSGVTVVPELAAWSGELLRHTGQGHRAHILMGQRRFSLAITKDKTLLLHNTFDHDAPEDVLYFVLAALEQLEIPQVDAQVTVGGQVQKDSGLMELLRRYLPESRMSERQPGITFAYSFKELPAHRSPLLLNLPLCV